MKIRLYTGLFYGEDMVDNRTLLKEIIAVSLTAIGWEFCLHLQLVCCLVCYP